MRMPRRARTYKAIGFKTTVKKFCVPPHVAAAAACKRVIPERCAVRKASPFAQWCASRQAGQQEGECRQYASVRAKASAPTCY